MNGNAQISIFSGTFQGVEYAIPILFLLIMPLKEISFKH